MATTFGGRLRIVFKVQLYSTLVWLETSNTPPAVTRRASDVLTYKYLSTHDSSTSTEVDYLYDLLKLRIAERGVEYMHMQVTSETRSLVAVPTTELIVPRACV